MLSIQRYLIEGLIVGAVIYFISYGSYGHLQVSEILLICVTSMLILAIFDRLSLKYGQTETFNAEIPSEDYFVPIGGYRSQILPLAEKDPKSLSVKECRKINTYLSVNPIERVNSQHLNQVYDKCKEKIAKRVHFNERVEILTPNGSLYSESLAGN